MTMTEKVHSIQKAGETMTQAIHRVQKAGQTMTEAIHEIGATPPAQPSKPGKPGAVTTSGITTDTIKFSWTAPTSGDAPTKYEISLTPAIPGTPADVTGTEYTVTGGTPATEYTLTVKACNAQGCSAAVSGKGTTATQDEPAKGTKKK